MPVGRYKHVASRFQQWRCLTPDCKSWINRRDDEPEGASAATAASASASGATAAAASALSATGRMGGDLQENVTEERLYQSRLYDLARERHKMIQESDYNRNQFIDRQVRKARSLGRLLQGLDIEQYRNKSASGIEKLRQRSAHARLMILAAKRLGLSIDAISKFSEEELQQRLNPPSSAAGVQEADVAVSDAAEASQTPLPPDQSQQPRPATSRTQPLGRPDLSRPSTVGFHRQQLQRPSSTATAGLLPRLGPDWRQSSSNRARGSVAFDGTAAAAAQTPDHRRPRTASARRRVQTDPRCVQLINTLTPRYKLASKADVGSIIRANPSLSQPTAGRPEQKQRQQAKCRRTRHEVLEMLDSIARTRYYEAGNLATLG